MALIFRPPAFNERPRARASQISCAQNQVGQTAFLTSSQGMPRLLVQASHFEKPGDRLQSWAGSEQPCTTPRNLTF